MREKFRLLNGDVKPAIKQFKRQKEILNRLIQEAVIEVALVILVGQGRGGMEAREL